MKKLLSIIALSLLLSMNAYAETEASIKHKRIECSYSELPGRWNNNFLIISDNDKKAELIQIPWDKVEKFQANITKDLQSITFKFINRKNSIYILDRETGILKVYVDNRFNHQKECVPFPENFNPEQFLKNEIKSAREKKIRKNKF